MESKIKAVGYIRVSTPRQVDDESLTTQRKSIESFAKKNDLNLIEIYADEGISGGSMKERHALLRCIRDAMSGKFKILIIHRLSRFGRNARELLENHNKLHEAGIEVRSVSEGIDFSTKYGKAMLGMFAVMAELERDIIRETMLENKIAKSRRGIPTNGTKPWGREYNRKTETWSVKEGAIEQLERAANEYLSGKTLPEVAKSLNMTRVNLLHIFKVTAGERWLIHYKGEKEPVVHIIPRLLSDEMIQKLTERIAFNRRNNRTDIVNKYVLSGFVRCEKCNGLLSGRTQRYMVRKTQTYNYMKYYAHVTKPRSTCPGTAIYNMDILEKAVFDAIFENLGDIPKFEKAIKESLPDDNMRNDIKKRIDDNKKELNKTIRSIDKLVESVLNETLSPQTIKKKEQELIITKNKLLDELDELELQLKSMPDIITVKQEAETIRRQILEKYRSKKRIQEMSYDEKRELLHWLFDGKDPAGIPFGIYLFKHPDKRIDYFLYGKVTGLRTIKGENINFIEEENSYKTNKVNQN